MGLGSRSAGLHNTVAVRKMAMDASVFHVFKEGQQVMTIDGVPGTVTAVWDGPVPGNEDYEVRLVNGVGGGHYTSSQLTAVGPAPVTAAEHLASDDYPELGSILHDRPPIECEGMRRQAAIAAQQCPTCKGTGYNENWEQKPDADQYENEDDAFELKREPCDDCGGTGTLAAMGDGEENQQKADNARNLLNRFEEHDRAVDSHSSRNGCTPYSCSHAFPNTRNRRSEAEQTLRTALYQTTGTAGRSNEDEPQDPTSMTDPFSWAPDEEDFENPDLSRGLPPQGLHQQDGPVQMPAYVDPEWKNHGH